MLTCILRARSKLHSECRSDHSLTCLYMQGPNLHSKCHTWSNQKICSYLQMPILHTFTDFHLKKFCVILVCIMFIHVRAMILCYNLFRHLPIVPKNHIAIIFYIFYYKHTIKSYCHIFLLLCLAIIITYMFDLILISSLFPLSLSFSLSHEN